MFLLPHYSAPLSSRISVLITSWCFTFKTILPRTVDQRVIRRCRIHFSVKSFLIDQESLYFENQLLCVL